MRKFMLLICAVMFLSTAFYSVNSVSAKVVRDVPITTFPVGDYTNDGDVNSADVVALINMYYGTTATSGYTDLYVDSTFDLNDVHVLIGFVQSRVPSLPVFPCTSENIPYPDPYSTPVISINGLPWVVLPCFSLYEHCTGDACMQPPGPIQP